jgi:hypothetical protein
MFKNKLKHTLVAFAALPLSIMAQDNPVAAIVEPDTIVTTVARLSSEVDILKRVKITGYMQMQYQYADSSGEAAFAGGNFASKDDSRFMIRRGRVRVNYFGKNILFSMQMNGSERGFNLIDIYAKYTESYLNSFSFQAGIFNRPFGYEISYSSVDRETPERMRLNQIIFNNERDLGVMLIYNPPSSSPLHLLTINAALVNGTGLLNPEFDDQKDFIGRVSISKPLMNESAKLGVGVSIYQGGFRTDTTVSYAMVDGKFVSSQFQDGIQQIMNRTIYSADAQFSIMTRLGLTTLRAEYTNGDAPSAAINSSNVQNTLLTPVSAATSKPAYYKRKFDGGYFYFIQNIGQTKHQVVFKYDWFDPNTQVSGDEVNSKNGLTGADIKFTTIGVGYNYLLDDHWKFSAYYDFIENETSQNMSGYTQNLTDDLLTLRVQFRF